MATPRLTDKGFAQQLQQLTRLAEIKGSRFTADTPEKQLRRRAEAVVLPEAFNRHYLGHYFRSAPAAFHLDLYRAIEQETRTVVRAPRGHAKSTVVTFAYSLHQVVCARVLRAWEEGRLEAEEPALYAAMLEVMTEAWLPDRVGSMRAAPIAKQRAAIEAIFRAQVDERHPDGRKIPLTWDPYIQIISVTESTASEFTEAIQLELLDNEYLRSDWGVLMPPQRQAAGDWVSATDVRVRAFGMMSAIRGGKHGPWRPTLAIADDPDSEETVGTVGLRAKQLKKLTAGLNYGLEPKKNRVFVVGTPIHPACIVCQLTAPDKFKRWNKLRFKAILDDGRVLWPERWTLAELRIEEEDDPEAFAMEMLDLPPSTGNPFTIVHYYDRAEYGTTKLFKILIFDPALGRTEKADYQAVITLRGPTKEGYILVHRVELLRIGDPRALVSHLRGRVQEDAPDAKIIETIGFQSLLAVMIDDAGEPGEDLLGWIQIGSERENKDLRIRGIAPAWNRGTLRFPSDRSCRPLEHQGLDYPAGKVDGLDALERGVRYIRESLRRSAPQEAVVHVPGRAVAFGPERGAW